MSKAIHKKNRFAVPIRIHWGIYPNEIAGFVETGQVIEDAGVAKGLRYLFLIHGVFSLSIGLSLYFIPLAWIGLTESVVVAQAFVRILGAFFIALGFKDLLCFRAGCWKEVCIVVLMEAILSLLAALGSLFFLLLIGISPGIVAMVLGFGIFSFAWSYFYVTCR